MKTRTIFNSNNNDVDQLDSTTSSIRCSRTKTINMLLHNEDEVDDDDDCDNQYEQHVNILPTTVSTILQSYKHHYNHYHPRHHHYHNQYQMMDNKCDCYLRRSLIKPRSKRRRIFFSTLQHLYSSLLTSLLRSRFSALPFNIIVLFWLLNNNMMIPVNATFDISKLDEFNSLVSSGSI